MQRYVSSGRSYFGDRYAQENQLAHDYDGTFAAEIFQDIIRVYYPLFEGLKEDVEKYYQ